MKDELAIVGALLLAGFMAGAMASTFVFEYLLSKAHCVC